MPALIQVIKRNWMQPWEVMSISFFYGREKQQGKRFADLPEITQLGSGRAQTQVQVVAKANYALLTGMPETLIFSG